MSPRTPGTGRQTEHPGTGRRSRRLALSLLAVLVVVVAGLAVVAGGLSSHGRPATVAGPSSAAVARPSEKPLPVDPGRAVPLATGTPVSVPPVVMAALPGAPTKLTPVALAASSDYGTGVTAALAQIKAVTAHGYGVGEISGPALSVTVRLTNKSAVPVSLTDVAVNLYRSAQGVRAARMTDGSSAPFHGQLAAGASAEATYVFSVPTDQRDVVTVTVGTSASTPTAVFSGPVS